ncbi:hypothetical protein BS329_40640 [Amycolatopsis coloradensis]|uniref:Uncharacterized protein n=1 Tax=Amycolatopsis coloradensis TaxID=76021 RepID=A0A1R0KDI4_9PSEU|nr:hypothetical protein BS329_40640 [Amycolatopsis coloradensis]
MTPAGDAYGGLVPQFFRFGPMGTMFTVGPPTVVRGWRSRVISGTTRVTGWTTRVSSTRVVRLITWSCPRMPDTGFSRGLLVSVAGSGLVGCSVTDCRM